MFRCVLDLLSSISSIREIVTRFEKAVGGASQSILESTSNTVSRDSVRDSLADEVVQMVERFVMKIMCMRNVVIVLGCVAISVFLPLSLLLTRSIMIYSRLE